MMIYGNTTTLATKSHAELMLELNTSFPEGQTIGEWKPMTYGAWPETIPNGMMVKEGDVQLVEGNPFTPRILSTDVAGGDIVFAISN